MSKLAHSNDETMEIIERDARARDERCPDDSPIEIISQHGTKIGDVNVTFTVGRISPKR